MESIASATPPPADAPQNERGPDAPRKIFISYAREDQEFALRLKRDLESEKLLVWIDETGIDGGGAWARNIEEALNDSTEFVLILSPASRASEFVENELITARRLKMHIRPVLYLDCEPWIHIARIQSIDLRTDEAYKKGLKKLRQPPRQTLWQRVISFPQVVPVASRPYLAVLTLGIAIAGSAYVFSPSNTSFIVSGDDKSAIVVRVRNRGGRPSTLIGSSFQLDFGNLPIEPEPLVLLQPEKYSRIGGHADTIIRLTAHNMLAPKMRDEESYFTEDDIRPRLAGAKLTLSAQVKESDGRFHTRSEQFFGKRIQNFMLEEFPNDVP